MKRAIAGVLVALGIMGSTMAIIQVPDTTTSSSQTTTTTSQS